MAVNNEFPVLDGVAPSWADVVAKLTGTGITLLEMKDIAAISTTRTLEVGELRGASGGRVIKRTTGSASYEASVTLYRAGFQKMLRTLMAAAPRRGNQALVSLVHFNIQVQHTPPGDTEIYERRIKGCRVMGDTLATAEGTDADQVEVPLSVIEVVDLIDGVEVVLL
jgi:hypothetical protein